MMKNIVIIFTFLVSCSLLAATPKDFFGDWEGSLTLGSMDLNMELKFKQTGSIRLLLDAGTDGTYLFKGPCDWFKIDKAFTKNPHTKGDYSVICKTNFNNFDPSLILSLVLKSKGKNKIDFSMIGNNEVGNDNYISITDISELTRVN